MYRRVGGWNSEVNVLADRAELMFSVGAVVVVVVTQYIIHRNLANSPRWWWWWSTSLPSQSCKSGSLACFSRGSLPALQAPWRITNPSWTVGPICKEEDKKSVEAKRGKVCGACSNHNSLVVLCLSLSVSLSVSFVTPSLPVSGQEDEWLRSANDEWSVGWQEGGLIPLGSMHWGDAVPRRDAIHATVEEWKRDRGWIWARRQAIDQWW